ncbi:MAG: hypothetical protein QXT10_03980 [Candidatus Bathyarchaeia archaeon]
MRLPTRLNFLFKFRNITVFFMVSASQTLEGITSKVGEDQHIILWDLEKCTLEQAKETLAEVQYKYRLGDIWITSDCEGSYRAWCFSRRPFKEYLKILLDTEHLDWNFFYWTVKRGQATLRTSNKQGRPPQKVVAYLKGYEPTEFPDKVVHVLYDTGVEKRGVVVKIGQIPRGVSTF